MKKGVKFPPSTQPYLILDEDDQMLAGDEFLFCGVWVPVVVGIGHRAKFLMLPGAVRRLR